MRYQLGRGFIPIHSDNSNSNSFLNSYFFVYFCKDCGTEILGKFDYGPNGYSYEEREEWDRVTEKTKEPLI